MGGVAVGGEGRVDAIEWEGGRGFEAVYLVFLSPNISPPTSALTPFVFHYSFALKEQS